MEPTSQQKLQRLLAEGKISREKYDLLISALEESEMQRAMLSVGSGQQDSKKRILKYCLFLSAAGLPIGLCFNTFLVWGLSIVGICVVIFMYARLDSWD